LLYAASQLDVPERLAALERAVHALPASAIDFGRVIRAAARAGGAVLAEFKRALRQAEIDGKLGTSATPDACLTGYSRMRPT